MQLRLVRPLLLSALLTSAACGPGHGGVSPHDQGVPAGDGGSLPPVDAALPPHDAAMPPPHDAGPPPPDLSPPPDFALPQQGLSWPPGQAFPTFAGFDTLDVIDTTSLTAERQTLVTTLAGLINRTKPRIYTIDGGGEGKTFWLDKLQVQTTTVTDPLALVTKYKSELQGIVIYDTTMLDTINLATVIAAQSSGVVASPTLATTLQAAPYSLPVLTDLRTNHFTTNTGVYQYELDHYAAGCTHRMIVGLNPSVAGNLRDYAAATQSMMVWLDPRVTAEASLLSSFLALLPANSPYLGWWADEPTGVHAASAVGVPTFAADFGSNLSVFGGTSRAPVAVPDAPAPPALANKVYVSIFMSDGDNVQEDEHLIPLKWNNVDRGLVPIGWTIDPALVDVAPNVLHYFQQTATLDDVLVSGPSGLGYTYPAAWPAATFDGYAKLSGRYMNAAGLNVITVWNNGVDLSGANMTSYLNGIPGLLGMTIQDESTALQLMPSSDIPLIRLQVSYGGKETDLEGGIDAQLATWSGAAPLFIAVQGDMNQSAITPGTFYATQQHYVANSNVQFVRPDHFFQLLKYAQAPAQHLVFGGDFDGNGKSDALFYYGGDGHVWMGLSDGSKLSWHDAADLSALDNLVDGRHAFYPGDFNGDGKTDLMIYSNIDGSWRLGLSDGTNMTFSVINTSSGYGNLLDGSHQTLVGDFNGDGKDDVLFYYNGDGNFWLGASTGSGLSWTNIGNAKAYGNLLDGTHALYSGDFDGNGKDDLLVYDNGDGNWNLGLSSGSSVSWSVAASTNNYGNLIDPVHRVVTGDFDGDGKRDLLFYYSGDGHWWMGSSDGSSFTWHQAAATPATTNLLDWNHRIFAGDFNGDGKSDVAVYDSSSSSWQLGISDGSSVTFAAAGSASGFGNLMAQTHILLAGDVAGSGKQGFIVYDADDGNWRLGTSSGTTLAWSLAGNTSGFGNLAR